MKSYTIGMDFGTLSVRSMLLDAVSHEAIGYHEYVYPHAVMEKVLPDGTVLEREFALQHPEDYLKGFFTVRNLLETYHIAPEEVGAIAVDFTTCTLLPVDEGFHPLCLKEEFASRPQAYVKLWKHHAAQPQADRITDLAAARKEPWLSAYGGRVSCEWLLPKVLECLEQDPEVFGSAYRFMEAGDWISFILTGKESHATAFAGFKALWTEGDYPSRAFMKALDPRLEDLFETKISRKIAPAGSKVGELNELGSQLTGLPVGVPVCAPMIDAQASMPAMNAVGEGEMMMVIGTSCCHIVNSRHCVKVPGIAGVAKEALVPGMYTYEAGQSGAGDCFDWFVKNCVPQSYYREAEDKKIGIHALLRRKAEMLYPGESGLIALDWLNGNRSVLCDHSLTGMFLGLSLSTRPEELYRALIEATAFGTRIIVEQYEQNGVKLSSLCATGGIPSKDRMLMQIFADVLNRPIRVPDVPFSGAKGSAIVASVVAGFYPDLHTACSALRPQTEKIYRPDPKYVMLYEKLYAEYRKLHDLFGKNTTFMKDLRQIAKAALAAKGGNHGTFGV